MDPKIDLKIILDLHYKWLRGDPCGSRANLSGANLYGADLTGANLSWANLYGANLYGANLYGANLTRANLSGADLYGAGLTGANLSGANLYGADLTGANLSWANLSGANLSGANLTRANLYGANLSGADLTGADLTGANLKECTSAELALAMASHLPEGDIIGWKKCVGGVIVKLKIPSKAKRSHGSERKCRAEFAKVIEVIGAAVGISQHDGNTEYRNGQMVYPDGWDEDRWNTCGQGIHFFITREEAEDY